MPALVAVLPADGSEIEFSAFIAAGRAAGAPVNLWLAAKHAGLVVCRIDETGRHMIRRA